MLGESITAKGHSKGKDPGKNIFSMFKEQRGDQCGWGAWKSGNIIETRWKCKFLSLYFIVNGMESLL